jgi:hypothetical protein
MTIYLYKKTHNKTGFKYLGKTIQDPHLYKGSGKDWLPHIKQYGYDVTTEILKECSSHDELVTWGRYYSDLWDVVKSNEWANRITETGGGDGSHWKGKRKDSAMGEKVSNTIKTRKSGKAFKQSGPDNHMFGKTGPLHHRYGILHSTKTKKLLSDNHHDVSGANNPRARKIKIVTASGEIYNSYGNLNELCKKLGLSINTVYIMLSTGKTHFTKGKFKGYRVSYDNC